MQPWIENPHVLISWLDMNQFGAQLFVNIGAWLSQVTHGWPTDDEPEREGLGDLHRDSAKTMFNNLSKLLGELGCNISAAAAGRLSSSAAYSKTTPQELEIRAKELKSMIFDEMKQQKFFWMPLTRSEWYEKGGRMILGDECVNRFTNSGIENEMDRAAKCFAFGQHTACVFHLMRISEAGVRALAKAVGYDWEQSPNWGKFYRQYDAQLATNPTKHTEPWLSHAEFLESVGGNLRAVKDAWRNNTMHLEKTYDEEQAKHLLAVVPSFMKQLASQVDEDGNFV